MERLRRRELDLALLTLPIVAADVEVRPALKEEKVVVTAPGHALMRERPVAPKSLGRFPLIVYESGSNTCRILDQLFVAEEVPVRIAMETENVEVIKAMVGNGLGVSIIPLAAAGEGRPRRAARLRAPARAPALLRPDEGAPAGVPRAPERALRGLPAVAPPRSAPGELLTYRGSPLSPPAGDRQTVTAASRRRSSVVRS